MAGKHLSSDSRHRILETANTDRQTRLQTVDCGPSLSVIMIAVSRIQVTPRCQIVYSLDGHGIDSYLGMSCGVARISIPILSQ